MDISTILVFIVVVFPAAVSSTILAQVLYCWWTRRQEEKVVILATTNPGKLSTWKRVLGARGFEVIPAVDICRERGIEPPEVEETGASFVENAMAKAWAFSKILGLPVWAEDSGIALRSTGAGYEWPGLHSNRFLGERSADGEAERNALRKRAYKLGDRHANCHELAPEGASYFLLRHQRDPADSTGTPGMTFPACIRFSEAL